MAILQVPVTKAKGKFVEFDTDSIPTEMYAEALLQGLKVLANRGTSKITKSTYPNAEELQAAALVKAEEMAEAIKTGDTKKVKLTGAAKSSKASGAVMTEARRLARNLVKDEMKRQGIKISHVEASEITKAANALLAEDETLVKQAEVNIEERSKVPVSNMIDIKSLIHISPELVAKAEAKKSKAKSEAGLSAKQAGKVKPRAKGQQASA